MRLSLVPFAAALAVGLLAAPAVTGAQSAPVVVTTFAKAQAGSYKVEPNHTQVMFSVLHMGFTRYDGRFSEVSGTLVYDPKKLSASQLEISIPTASVSTTSDKLDGELKSADWLDAGAFPNIAYRSTKVTPMGASRARIDGELTLHGVTRPVSLMATFVGGGTNPMSKAYTIGFSGMATIKRSDFGVKTYVPLIGDTVTVTINAAFEHDGGRS